MNLLDPNLNEPITFERLTYVSPLNRFEPGPMRELAVMGDPVWVGLGRGRKSWFDLAHWLGQRGIVCEISGPFWTLVEMVQYEHDYSFAQAHVFRMDYEAVALVQMDRAEDIVRFERELLRGFGRPARECVMRSISRTEIERRADIVEQVKNTAIEVSVSHTAMVCSQTARLRRRAADDKMTVPELIRMVLHAELTPDEEWEG